MLVSETEIGSKWYGILTGDVWICSGFERAETVANDENTSAKASEAVGFDSSNCTERSNT